MLHFRILPIFFLILFLSFDGKSQGSFKEIEDSLAIYIKQVKNEKTFSAKENVNSKFLNLLRKALEKEGSIDYPFDSVKHIGKLASKEGNVRVYTWDLPQSGGYYKYFGFIQVRKDKKNTLLYELRDNHKAVKDPINDILDMQNWMGALYYSMIEEKLNDKEYYILLGFDFNNIFSSKKLIEVLSFDADLKPIFGLPIFKVGSNSLSRVVFEFSARATMSLRYISDIKTIAFDHLSPSKPNYVGNYQFYGPDFTYDGFKIEKGCWIYIPELDLKNSRHEIGRPIDTIQKPPEPGFLYKSKHRKLNDF